MTYQLILFIKSLESLLIINTENIIKLILKKTISEEKKRKAEENYNEWSWHSNSYKFGNLFDDNENSDSDTFASEITSSITKEWTTPIKIEREYIESLIKDIDKLRLLNEKLSSFIREIEEKQTKQNLVKNGKFGFMSKIICWHKNLSNKQIIKHYKVKITELGLNLNFN